MAARKSGGGTCPIDGTWTIAAIGREAGGTAAHSERRYACRPPMGDGSAAWRVLLGGGGGRRRRASSLVSPVCVLYSLNMSRPPVSITTRHPAGHVHATSSRAHPPLITTAGSVHPSLHSAGSVTWPPREPQTRHAYDASSRAHASSSARPSREMDRPGGGATPCLSGVPPPSRPCASRSASQVSKASARSIAVTVRLPGSYTFPASVARFCAWSHATCSASASCNGTSRIARHPGG